MRLRTSSWVYSDECVDQHAAVAGMSRLLYMKQLFKTYCWCVPNHYFWPFTAVSLHAQTSTTTLRTVKQTQYPCILLSQMVDLPAGTKCDSTFKPRLVPTSIECDVAPRRNKKGLQLCNLRKPSDLGNAKTAVCIQVKDFGAKVVMSLAVKTQDASGSLMGVGEPAASVTVTLYKTLRKVPAGDRGTCVAVGKYEGDFGF